MQNQTHVQQGQTTLNLSMLAEQPSLEARLASLKEEIALMEFAQARQRAERGLHEYNQKWITIEELEAMVKDCNQSMVDPLNYGEWISFKTGEYRWRWQGMTYGCVSDTRKTEDRCRDVALPFRTSDDVLHQTLRKAKLHELATHAKIHLQEDGYLPK